MLTVKLTKSSSSDPQNTGLEPVANPPGWRSETAVSLNLTIPAPITRAPVAGEQARHEPAAGSSSGRRSFSGWRGAGSTMTILKGGMGCSAVRGASSWLRATASRTSRWARGSPLTASTNSLRMSACVIDRVIVRSPSRTVIRRAASSRTICVSRSGGCAGVLDVVPFGRPRGFPDWPGAKRCASGGWP